MSDHDGLKPLAWAAVQLDKAEATEEEGRVALDLLDTWVQHGIGNRPDNDPSTLRALDFFRELALGHALLPPQKPDDPQYRWEDARPGQLVVSDVVRVKTDAYQGSAGELHNGRSGRIVAIRGGDIHVVYDDGGIKASMPPRHSPHKLEKRYMV